VEDKYVYLYTSPLYGGGVSKLKIGTYSIHTLGIPNDSCRSIRVDKGLQVMIYEHNFSGKFCVLMHDEPLLSTIGFDKNITSCVVSYDPSYLEEFESGEKDKSDLSSVGLSNAEFYSLIGGLAALGLIVGIGVYFLSKNFRTPKLSLVDTQVDLGEDNFR
jgi:hypothetical protein